MLDDTPIDHHIQKHILSVLMNQQYARFRDMRPASVDTNLYSYHLKRLMKTGYVVKSERQYTLGNKGQFYVDRMNASTARLTYQPKVITMIVIQDGYGNVLMYQKLRQPFIGRWTVPFGKVHNTDTSIAEAAQREVREKIGDNVSIELSHAGDCYIRICDENQVQISTLVHVFYGTTDDDLETDHLKWISPHKLIGLETAPAVEQIITRTFFRDPFYFEEYTEQLAV